MKCLKIMHEKTYNQLTEDEKTELYNFFSPIYKKTADDRTWQENEFQTLHYYWKHHNYRYEIYDIPSLTEAFIYNNEEGYKNDVIYESNNLQDCLKKLRSYKRKYTKFHYNHLLLMDNLIHIDTPAYLDRETGEYVAFGLQEYLSRRSRKEVA